MNSFINSYKQTVNDFHQKKAAFEAEIQSNNRKYSEEFAERYNEEVKQRQTSAYLSAKESINKSFEQIRGLLACAAFPRVESLTADRLLLENPNFVFTKNDILGLVERYQERSNFTMLKLISGWIEQHKDPEKGLEDPYGDIRIMSPEDLLQVYQQFAQGALSVIDTVNSSPSASVKASVDAYADERFAKELFDIVGSGSYLRDFDTKDVPEIARHCYDSVTLQL